MITYDDMLNSTLFCDECGKEIPEFELFYEPYPNVFICRECLPKIQTEEDFNDYE